MPKLSLTTLMIFTSIFGATTVACAQDADWTTQPATEINHFAGADTDASGTLTLDEFQVYAVSKAEAGDANFAEVLASGEYAEHFAAKDTDADGLLSEAELESSEDETSMPDPKVIDDPDMIKE